MARGKNAAASPSGTSNRVTTSTGAKVVAMSELRRAVEVRSGPLLVIMARRPVVPGLVVGVLVLAGLLLHGLPGALLLLLLAVLVAWLTYLAWPALRAPARVPRLAVLILLLTAAVIRLR